MYIRGLFVFAVLVASFAVFAGFTSDAHAAAPTVHQVNQALRDAGMPVTANAQHKFAARVVRGHFSSYPQLVGAMQWHKQFGKGTVGGAKHFGPEIRQTLNAEVVNIHPTRVSVWPEGMRRIDAVPVKYIITDATKFDSHIKEGSRVEITFVKGSRNAIRVKNLAPVGQEDYYGPVDCASCSLR